MFKAISDNLHCDFCEEGRLHYDPEETFKSYFIPETFALKDIKDLIDKSINEYLVFKCYMCGQTKKYTFKDIEKKVRENMYKKIIRMISIKELKNSKHLNTIDRTRVYCGKCDGFDGKGSCPIKIYEECKIKRFPREL